LLSVVARHRGQGYEKEISFEVLVQLIADALLEHQGSGKRSFARGREQGLLTASVQAVYQKLSPDSDFLFFTAVLATSQIA
jgi:hypothetical protein